jgi:hypothetical protein
MWARFEDVLLPYWEIHMQRVPALRSISTKDRVHRNGMANRSRAKDAWADRIHPGRSINRMKRFAGLFRETWWVWLQFAGGTLLAFVVTDFLVNYRYESLVCVFALVRYDESATCSSLAMCMVY